MCAKNWTSKKYVWIDEVLFINVGSGFFFVGLVAKAFEAENSRREKCLTRKAKEKHRDKKIANDETIFH